MKKTPEAALSMVIDLLSEVRKQARAVAVAAACLR
jgi:hypothetical protein